MFSSRAFWAFKQEYLLFVLCRRMQPFPSSSPLLFAFLSAPGSLMVLGHTAGWSCRWTELVTQKIEPMGEQIVTVFICFGPLGQNNWNNHLSGQPRCHHSVAQLLSPGWDVWRSHIFLAWNWVISKLGFVCLGVQCAAGSSAALAALAVGPSLSVPSVAPCKT